MSAAALIIVEHSAGRPRRACLEALGRVRSLGLEAVALVMGRDVAAVGEAARVYADRVLVADHELLEHHAADAHVAVAAGVASDVGPVLILGPATSRGRDLLSRLAARLGEAYAAEITELDMDDAGRPHLVRPVHGGKAFAEVAFPGDGPVLATVRANVFELPDAGGPGSLERIEPVIDPASVRTRVTSVETTAGDRVPLTEAEIVVTGGRGLGEPGNFVLLERLADRLGAAVGASRAVVDAGWREASDQVGKSGNTVSPRLYVAFGVSGAVHHVMGMDGSGTVVVVNKDANALFFEHADHGLVADALEVLPALLEELGGG